MLQKATPFGIWCGHRTISTSKYLAYLTGPRKASGGDESWWTVSAARCGVMPLGLFHGECFRSVPVARESRAGSRRAWRPLRGLRSGRVAPAECGSGGRLRHRPAGWPRGPRRSSRPGVARHRWGVVSRGLTPLCGVTYRVRPRARPWQVCGPTRAGARDAVDGQAVTGRHRTAGAAHSVAGPCRDAP
jgi:hypothetical protein